MHDDTGSGKKYWETAVVVTVVVNVVNKLLFRLLY